MTCLPTPFLPGNANGAGAEEQIQRWRRIPGLSHLHGWEQVALVQQVDVGLSLGLFFPKGKAVDSLGGSIPLQPWEWGNWHRALGWE